MLSLCALRADAVNALLFSVRSVFPVVNAVRVVLQARAERVKVSRDVATWCATAVAPIAIVSDLRERVKKRGDGQSPPPRTGDSCYAANAKENAASGTGPAQSRRWLLTSSTISHSPQTVAAFR